MFIYHLSEGVLDIAGVISAVDINIGGDAIAAAEDRGMIDRLYGSTRGFISFHKASDFRYLTI